MSTNLDSQESPLHQHIQTMPTQQAAGGYEKIRRHTLEELKGVFTGDEISMLLNAQYNKGFSDENLLNNGAFLSFLDMLEESQHGITDFEVNPEQIKLKISGLTAVQVFILREELDLFANDRKANFRSFLEEFCNK